MGNELELDLMGGLAWMLKGWVVGVGMGGPYYTAILTGSVTVLTKEISHYSELNQAGVTTEIGLIKEKSYK